jgi:hypothetical protein
MAKEFKKIRKLNKSNYRIIVFIIVLIVAFQFWMLRGFFSEVKFEIPYKLFSSTISFPLSEMTLGAFDADPYFSVFDREEDNQETIAAETQEFIELFEESTSAPSMTSDDFELSEIQKKIVLRLMQMPEENIEYKYEAYPDTGYPTEKVGISTDVISIVLRDSGYDLMELIYEDMNDHKDAYPMDKKGSDSISKSTDFRRVYFQQKFFERNGLVLPNEFDAQDEANQLQWQPGDVIFFQVDPDNSNLDLAGMLSSRKNEEGIPLVIMNSSDLGMVSEVDVLLEYEIIGHYRYPYPELFQ